MKNELFIRLKFQIFFIHLLTVRFLVKYTHAQTTDFVWQQYTEPEFARWSSGTLENALDYALDLNSSAVMVVHKGKVVIAWGDLETNFKCHSIRKAFLSD
jgi:hypothetical protein